ncbi:MAG: hypothetical protein IKK17_07815 [Oscillospiraceae bacterium]|nr:hypothetical protein [Oscillospiraceae bacterium]
MANTIIKKNISKSLSEDGISVYQARRIKRAILQIDRIPIDILCKIGKVVKINAKGYNNLYAYRLSNTSRIVFSVENGTNIVQEIIDTHSTQNRFKPKMRVKIKSGTNAEVKIPKKKSLP